MPVYIYMPVLRHPCQRHNMSFSLKWFLIHKTFPSNQIRHIIKDPNHLGVPADNSIAHDFLFTMLIVVFSRIYNPNELRSTDMQYWTQRNPFLLLYYSSKLLRINQTLDTTLHLNWICMVHDNKSLCELI